MLVNEYKSFILLLITISNETAVFGTVAHQIKLLFI
jgi:hypothetical protein